MKFSNLLFLCGLILPAGSLVAAANDAVVHFVEGRPVIQRLPELRNRDLGSQYLEGMYPFFLETVNY